MIAVLRKHSFRTFEIIGDYVTLCLDVLVAALKKPPAWRLIREHLFHIGVMSLSVVAITGFTTGFVLATQSFYQLGETGLATVTGVLVLSLIHI